MLAAEGDLLAEVPTTTELRKGGTDLKWEEFSFPDYLTSEQTQQLKQTLQKYGDVFQDQPGCADVTPFKIKTGSNKPVASYPRRLPEKWREKISQEVKSLLSTGIIVPSESAWASPIVPVPKPDGSVRMCVDYQSVNAVTEPDVYPLPRMEQLLEEMSRAHYITTMDLVRGYYQFPVAPEDQPKTAFVTPNGKWQFTKMPFGLKGAPAKFQREMDQLFSEHPNLSAYIDDVAVYSMTWEEHLQHVQAALKLLREKGLTVKVKKCKFARREVSFLGHTVGGGKVKTQEAKVKTILEMPVPTTKKELQSFLGSTGYYRKVVEGYSTIAACLSNLTRKKLPEKLKWTSEHQQAFERLKTALVTAPVLATPQLDRPFILSTDASGQGIGAVLEQESKGEVHPVAYYSRKLSDREKKWGITELEALALHQGVRHFSVYLLGNVTKVYTDHKALIYMEKMKGATPRINRWLMELQQFQLEI